ncbi:restriction endonuclease [Paenibacillus sp. FSL R5-0345]|uniref:restriction endonuclease n=1 Tax=Paenibacillus sp. FSL R5-0345 TaxID=1536770 RepID=UPI0009DD69C2
MTTGKFTHNAYTYAEGLDIELINGKQLVELWLKHLETKSESVIQFNPVSQI